MNKLEMYLVNIWCKLDNAYSALDKLVISAELEDNETIDRLRFNIKSMAIEIREKRDIVMRKLGYKDYDELVEYLETNKKAVYNKVNSNWEIPYEIYL